ncbi:hypothetical protein PO909_028228 [Leuciscus waleckii]
MGSASGGFGVGAKHYKERLLATVLSMPPPRCGARRNYGENRSITSTSSRNIETVEQRGHRAVNSSSEQRGAVQQILPGTEKRRGSQTHTRSKAAEQSACETPVQNAHNQKNPCADSPRGLVYVNRSEGRVFSNTDSVTSQAIFEIRLRGPGISVHSPAVRLVPSTPYIYDVHGRSARTPQTPGHASIELLGRLAVSSSITLGAHRAQDHFTRTPREFGSQSQLGEEFSVSQSDNILSGHRTGLAVYDSATVPLRKFQRMLGLMASASSVLQLGLLRMRPLQFWLKARVPHRAWTSDLLRLKVNQKSEGREYFLCAKTNKNNNFIPLFISFSLGLVVFLRCTSVLYVMHHTHDQRRPIVSLRGDV